MQFLENEIRDYTESIWKSILDLETKPAQDEFEFSQDKNSLAGCVHITGAWEGSVAIHCPDKLARQWAAIMFGLDEANAQKEEIQDALGELTNMTGGNIKSLLPEPCQLSIPAVAYTDHAMRFPGSELVTQITFKCNSNFFLVSLLKKMDEFED